MPPAYRRWGLFRERASCPLVKLRGLPVWRVVAKLGV